MRGVIDKIYPGADYRGLELIRVVNQLIRDRYTDPRSEGVPEGIPGTVLSEEFSSGGQVTIEDRQKIYRDLRESQLYVELMRYAVEDDPDPEGVSVLAQLAGATARFLKHNPLQISGTDFLEQYSGQQGRLTIPDSTRIEILAAAMLHLEKEIMGAKTRLKELDPSSAERSKLADRITIADYLLNRRTLGYELKGKSAAVVTAAENKYDRNLAAWFVRYGEYKDGEFNVPLARIVTGKLS